MELKVWVEGIQRVVCGVNEKTTCQDVVYALAHATGKTGRFTLIERWRNSERLLAPGEQPLKVLLKWGEHSNDVQFILQWSPLDSSSNSSTKNTSPVKSGHLPPHHPAQPGNNNGGGGEHSLADSVPHSQLPFKGGGGGGTSTSSSSYSPGSGVSGSTNQTTGNSIPQSNGLSASSSSKKLPYSGASSSANYHHLHHPQQQQRPSPALAGQNPLKQQPPPFSHPQHMSGASLHQNYNGGSVVGSRLASSNEASSSSSTTSSSSVMKGASQRLIHSSDAIVSGGGKVSGGGSPALHPQHPHHPHSQSHLPQLPPPPVGGKMKELSAPPPYREPPNPISYQGKVSPSVSSPSLKGLPPYREPPPPTMMIQQQQQSPSQYPPPNAYALRQQQPRSSHSPVRGMSSSQSQSYFASSANSSSSSLLANSNGNGGTTSSSSVVSTSGVPSSKESLSKQQQQQPPHHHAPPPSAAAASSTSHDAFPSAFNNNNASDKSDNPLSSQNGSVNKNASGAPSSIDNSPNSHYKDLVRLVNSQREKLTSQQAELTQYDAEIMFWEGKAKEQQRNMEYITKEISRLELISSQNEGQMLSLTHLEEENDYICQESESLRSELTSLRNDMGKCENELDKCKNRLRRLAEELHATQAAASQRQEEWNQREAATMAEVDRLKKELELARRETDAVSDLSGTLDKEVHSLDSNLAEKKKQMEQLVSAMKEANLQSLIINPPSEELVDGGAHQRSGSTRRMIGSPRQLENAAPTSKNPHGVWV